MAHGSSAKAGELAELGQGLRHRGFAEHEQQGARQSRLYEDVERAAARTCGGDHELAPLAGLLDLLGGHDLDELGRALGKGAESLAPNDRLGAAPSDPTAQAAIRGDDRLVPGSRRGRRLDAHDSRERAWNAISRVLTQQLQYVVAYSVTPFERNAAHTLSDVTGMSMLVIPYGESASITALTYAAGEPTVADSPTPLAPSGWCGEGVTVWPISNLGVSIDPGIR